MPELPEVEVTRRGLLPHILKKKVQQIWLSGKKLRQPVPRKLLQTEICDHKITTIDRRAKYLLFRMTNNAVLLLHLGMTGKLSILPKETAKAKHDHLALRLDNDMELRFNDSRRFGSVAVWPGDKTQELEELFNRHEGIEPFGDEFNEERLHNLAKNRSIGIKAFLMNSRLISGVGNIYANETLFLTGLHPEMPARELSKKQWKNLIANCRQTLSLAIEAGGTTISDFLGSSGQPGYFQLQLHVYGKEKEACPRCKTPITKTVIAGRATFSCPQCQPNSGTKRVATKRHT